MAPRVESVALRPAARVFNPKAGQRERSRSLDAILRALAESGYDTEAIPTQAAGHAIEIARSAAQRGVAAVFALGGDGTAREVAEGLYLAAIPKTALGLLPGGTTNVLAKALGIPCDPLAAARAVAAYTPRPFDIGLANGKPFLMMVSVGLDVEALRATNSQLKRRFGRAAVGLAALKAWWTYDYPEFTVTANGETHKATFVAVSNIELYGGKFRLAPRAQFDDGKLDLVSFSGKGRWAMLLFALALARGRHIERSDTRRREIESAMAISANQSSCAQIDGDVTAVRARFDIQMKAKAISILARSDVGASKDTTR